MFDFVINSKWCLAFTVGGNLYTFGDGQSGQLGLGTKTMQTFTPEKVKLGFKLKHVSCGENYTAIVSGKLNKNVFIL